MIALKLRRVGDSVGAVLPEEALSKLRAREGDTIYLTESNDGFRLTIGDPEFERQMEIAETGMHDFRKTLRALAK